MIRILHVIGAMDRAGAETFIMNLFRSIDRSQFAFDFAVHVESECDYDKEIDELGGRIFRFPKYNGLNVRKYRKEWRDFYKSHPDVDIVHGHIGSSAPIYLSEARRAGIPAIAHSHNYVPLDSVSSVIFRIASRPVVRYADSFMACSIEAADDRFGAKIAHGNNCSIINNGINVSLYGRDSERVSLAKLKLNLSDNPIFCNIGRFNVQKNHGFLVDVFREILTALPNAKLLLVGRGEEESKIRGKVKQYGMTGSVCFLGIMDDIPDVLRASDVFLFPSLYEGLGVALIEAQATGLPSLVSDAIPDLSILTEKTIRLPLGDAAEWASRAVSLYKKYRDDCGDCIKTVREKGFDIEVVAKELEGKYREIVSGRRKS